MEEIFSVYLVEKGELIGWVWQSRRSVVESGRRLHRHKEEVSNSRQY